MQHLNLIGVFVRVAETRSFTAAAHRVGMSASGVSKSISQLEKALGIQLVNRSTRKVGLTAEGEGFYEKCRHLLAAIEEAEAALIQTRASPRGRVKMQLPTGFGRKVFIPALDKFASRYPEIALDIELSDRSVDLIDEGLDVIVTLGKLNDSRLAARQLTNLRFATCASPEYLAKWGEPKTPEQLDSHQCLAFMELKTGRYRDWVFEKDGKKITKSVSGVFNFNHVEALMDAAIAGHGIATVADFIVAEAVNQGKLKILLKSYQMEGPPVSVMYVPSRYLSPRIRAVVDFLRDLDIPK